MRALSWSVLVFSFIAVFSLAFWQSHLRAEFPTRPDVFRGDIYPKSISIGRHRHMTIYVDARTASRINAQQIASLVLMVMIGVSTFGIKAARKRARDNNDIRSGRWLTSEMSERERRIDIELIIGIIIFVPVLLYLIWSIPESWIQALHRMVGA